MIFKYFCFLLFSLQCSVFFTSVSMANGHFIQLKKPRMLVILRSGDNSQVATQAFLRGDLQKSVTGEMSVQVTLVAREVGTSGAVYLPLAREKPHHFIFDRFGTLLRIESLEHTPLAIETGEYRHALTFAAQAWLLATLEDVFLERYRSAQQSIQAIEAAFGQQRKKLAANLEFFFFSEYSSSQLGTVVFNRHKMIPASALALVGPQQGEQMPEYPPRAISDEIPQGQSLSVLMAVPEQYGQGLNLPRLRDGSVIFSLEKGYQGKSESIQVVRFAPVGCQDSLLDY